MNLGVAQRRLGDLEAAKASFAQAVARHPESADALRALAAVAVDQGDYVLALDTEAKLEQLGRAHPGAELQHRRPAAAVELARKTPPDPIAGPPKRSRISPKRCSIWAMRWKRWGRKKKRAPRWQQAVEVKPELAEKYF